MSLPHQTALARDCERRPGSHDAAEAYARGCSGRSPGRIEWTPGNIARLIAVLTVGAVASVGLAMCGAAVSSQDPSTPRGAANAYFAAVQRGDGSALSTLQCADMYNEAGRDAVAEALQAESGRRSRVLLGPGYGHGDTSFFDFVVVGRARGGISVHKVRGEERYLVCDFFDVQVRRP